VISSQVKIGDMLARYMAASNLLGRLHIVRVGLAKTRRPVRMATGSHLIHTFAQDQENTEKASFDVGFSFDLPSTGAVDFLRDLTPVTREVFDGLSRQYRSDAFTIAGVNDQRVIGKVRDALTEIVAHGGTRADFEREVHQITTDAGVSDLTAFELDTVFHTNTAKAYSAGRLEQMQEPHMMEALPFWQYWTVGDLHVRPGHAELDGFIARAIDPVWRKIYPPWDFNCRCSVVPLTEEEALEIDPGCSEGGIERLGTKPFTLLELKQTDFHSLMAA
jgi:SPP1 gp7 family putative phage head morphogenesis protein